MTAYFVRRRKPVLAGNKVSIVFVQRRGNSVLQCLANHVLREAIPDALAERFGPAAPFLWSICSPAKFPHRQRR